MALDGEIAALAADRIDREDRRRRKLREALRRMAGRQAVHDAYRAVFCTEDGEISADALTVLHDLAATAGLGHVRPLDSDAELRMAEGRRHMMLHVFDRLDLGGERMLRLSKRIREIET